MQLRHRFRCLLDRWAHDENARSVNNREKDSSYNSNINIYVTYPYDWWEDRWYDNPKARGRENVP